MGECIEKICSFNQNIDTLQFSVNTFKIIISQTRNQLPPLAGTLQSSRDFEKHFGVARLLQKPICYKMSMQPLISNVNELHVYPITVKRL